MMGSQSEGWVWWGRGEVWVRDMSYAVKGGEGVGWSKGVGKGGWVEYLGALPSLFVIL